MRIHTILYHRDSGLPHDTDSPNETKFGKGVVCLVMQFDGTITSVTTSLIYAHD